MRRVVAHLPPDDKVRDDARRRQLHHELKTLQQNFALTRTSEHMVRTLQKETKSAPRSCLPHTFAPIL
jgi:hypothetical protein